MKKLTLGLISAAIAAVFPAAGMAQSVDVNISLPLPPAPVVAVEAAAPEVAPPAPLQFQTAPDMVVVPSGNAYVYMVPNVYGVYFYDGFWFRYHNGFWFRSGAWNGYWSPVQIGVVPGIIIGVAPEYAMVLPVGYYRIPFGHFHTHWRSWGHNHHWHGHNWFRNEMRRHVRNDRLHNINRLHNNSRLHSSHRAPIKTAPKGGVSKIAPNNKIHKTAPNGLHKSGARNIHKGGPAGAHKIAKNGHGK